MCLGVPTRIIELCDKDAAHQAAATAIVELSGVRRAVNVSLLLEELPADQLVGQWAIVHAGFAISLVDEEEASAMLQMVDELESLS